MHIVPYRIIGAYSVDLMMMRTYKDDALYTEYSNSTDDPIHDGNNRNANQSIRKERDDSIDAAIQSYSVSQSLLKAIEYTCWDIGAAFEEWQILHTTDSYYINEEHLSTLTLFIESAPACASNSSGGFERLANR